MSRVPRSRVSRILHAILGPAGRLNVSSHKLVPLAISLTCTFLITLLDAQYRALHHPACRNSPYSIKDNIIAIDTLISTYIILKNYILIKQKVCDLFNCLFGMYIDRSLHFYRMFFWVAYLSFLYFPFYILLF